MSEMTEEEFAAFVAAGSWTFAKTMADIPHEYVVLDWYADPEVWKRAAAFVKEHGRPGRWRRYRNQYLEHDGWSYWVIWPIINRAVVPYHPQNAVEFLDDGPPAKVQRRQRRCRNCGREGLAKGCLVHDECRAKRKTRARRARRDDDDGQLALVPA